MKAICVDDENMVLEYTISQCRELAGIDEAAGFTNPLEALKWVEDNPVDIAILDIDMPEMNGLVLAKKIKEKRPETAVIFLTAYSEYALDAFSVRATGYLLKPINQERLEEEVEYAISSRKAQPESRIAVRTFGNFEVLVDGKMVAFHRAKAKELLAYLVDRQGSSTTRPDIFAALWEDSLYDHSMQKQLDVVIRSLKDTLREYGISEIFEMKSGFIRIRPELFDCDLYRFLKGDVQAVNSYRGEYMNLYSWAQISEASLAQKQNFSFNGGNRRK